MRVGPLRDAGRAALVVAAGTEASWVSGLAVLAVGANSQLTTRSVVTMASFRLLEDQQMPVTLAIFSCGA